MMMKTKTILIIGLLLLAMIPTAYAVKLSQVERSCSDGWEINRPCSAIYDKDITTYAQDKYNREVSYYYVNYTRPRRFKKFIWTVWDSEGKERFVIKKKSACWNKKVIQLRATHMKYTGKWQCYDGEDWITLRKFIGYELFEERGRFRKR